MSSINTVTAPAGIWTEIDPGTSLGLSIANRSFSLPVCVAVSETEPDTSAGFFVLAPDAAGAHPITEIRLGAGESVWVRPHDHSGLAATIAYQQTEGA